MNSVRVRVLEFLFLFPDPHGLSFLINIVEPCDQQSADPISILVPYSQDKSDKLISCIRKALGKGYTLRTWHHGHARLDHTTILADITCKLVPPPSSANMRVRTREIIDHKAWSAQVDHRHERVSRCSLESAMLGHPPAEISLQKSIHKQIQTL